MLSVVQQCPPAAPQPPPAEVVALDAQEISARLEPIKPDWIRQWRVAVDNHHVTIHAAVCNGPSKEQTAGLRSLAAEAVAPAVLLDLLLYHRPAPAPVARKALPAKEPGCRLNDEALWAEVLSTLPAKVELIRPLRYHVPLQRGRAEFAVLRLFVPPAQEAALAAWCDDFQKANRIKIFIEHAEQDSGVRRELRKLVGSGGVLTAEHIPKLERIIACFTSQPPPAPPAKALARALAPLPDLTGRGYLTIDAAGVLDREDMVWAETLPDGVIRLSVAIVDVSWFATPGSPWDLHAQSLGESVYGLQHAISTLGNETSFGVASFLPGQDRPAWIIEALIEPDGTYQFPQPPYLARARAAEHVTPEDFGAAANGPGGEHLEALCEAVWRLEHGRDRGERAVRTSGETAGDRVVEACMLMAKHGFARFLAAHDQAPAIFKTHQPPSNQLQRVFVRRLAQQHIRKSRHDLEVPSTFLGVLEELHAKSTNGGSDVLRARARELAGSLISAYLTRSVYNAHNRGHYALGLDAFAQIKGRYSAGIVNQYQARCLVEGDGKPLDAREIRKRVRHANRRHNAIGQMMYRLRVLERLKLGLSCGKEYSADGEEIRAANRL